MSFQLNAGKSNLAAADQVCAKGWQDYMIETQYFLGETRVKESLNRLSTRQLEKLGLSENEVRKVRTLS